MSKIRKILSILILPFIVGCIGLIGNYTDAHAAEANAGDSFEIYAGSMVCYTDVGGNPYSPPGFNGGSNCSKSGTSGSAKVVYKGNGNYSIEDEKWGVLSDAARSIRLSISGGKLKVDVASNCESKQAAEVSLNSDISAFKNSVNSSLGGTSWSFFCPLYDGDNSTYYQRSTLEFSTSDVTKAEAVPEIDPGTAGGETNTGDNATPKPTCMNSGGSGTLGWIVCSIMEWLGDAANGAYKEYVEPSLQVDPKLFEGGDDGVRGGWETFRNIANVVFIILFLVVIFSQLTGVGIDNYGIKKILPKLIVSAILINLSYWICLVFIDLSNILGNSFQALFDGLGSSLGEPQLNISGADSVGAIPTGGIVTVGVLGALVVMVGSVWANPAVVLSLLVAALGVAISIFFLFILLSAREAAIIVLTVLSPLAVVCYMLPNTKSMFDKWVKLFEAMLLVYPICGLLVGGGNYISRLLLSSGFGGDGFFRAFTAMIVGIVPIFFIPSVLKGSFSAMGSLGAKISGIGQKVSGTATGAARGSQAYKNMQERGAMRRTRIAAGLNRKGEETGLSRGVGRVMNFGRGGKRAMAGNRAQYLKGQDAENRADSLMGVGYEAARIAQEKKASSDAVADWEMLVDNESQNGSNYDSLIDKYKKYMAEGNTDGAKAVARVAGRRKDLAAKFMKDAFTGEGATSGYSAESVASVAKEMVTGSSSGTYRAASPLGYSFASQINENPDKAKYNYSGEGGWLNQDNVHNALGAFVTNRSELAGVKGSELEDLFKLMGGSSDAKGNVSFDPNNATMMSEDVSRMQALATDVIENRDKEPIDLTKAEQLAHISGKYKYNSVTGDFEPINGAQPNASHGSSAPMDNGVQLDVSRGNSIPVEGELGSVSREPRNRNDGLT